MYSENDWRSYSELYHHGILGQKWGHKNGPPYPLDAGDHSASEKKAGWKQSLSDNGISSTLNDRELKEMRGELKRALQKYSTWDSSKDPETDTIAVTNWKKHFEDGKNQSYDKVKTAHPDNQSVRYNFYGGNQVLEEDWDNHKWVLLNTDAISPTTITVVKTKGNTVYLAAYSSEGLINQNAAKKRTDSIKHRILINQ